MLVKLGRGILVSLALLLGSCASFKAKDKYHDLAVTQDQFSLTSDILLLGMEKPRGTRGFSRALCFEGQCKVARGIPAHLPKDVKSEMRGWDNQRQQFLTHIVDIPGGNNQSPKVLYSLYEQSEVQIKAQQDAPLAGFDALLASKAELEKQIQEQAPTHIIVLSTGWNTHSRASLENYDKWMRNINKAAQEDAEFRPLYIGLLWQSSWGRTLNFFLKVPSVFTKGNDADELGALWVNTLVNEVLPQSIASLERKPQIVLVGHSYGLRVLGHAVFLPELGGVAGDVPKSNVDLLIGLQPALPRRRFTSIEKRRERYWHRPTQVPVVFTHSKHDLARVLAWGYVLGADCERPWQKLKVTVACAKADWNGHAEFARPAEGNWNLHITNSRAFVKGHGDVFEEKAGRFIFEAIRHFSGGRG